MTKEDIKMFNIITLGDSGVGKTSIINRFIDNIFDNNISSTIGMNFRIKEMIVNEKDKVKLKLTDTCGQEKYRALTKTYLKNADVVLFVFSMDDNDPFNNIAEWIKLFKENNCKEENAPKYLVGNKSDLKIEVKKSLIDEFAKKNDIPFISTSAKENKCINELFELIGEKLYLDNKQKGVQKQNNIKIKFEKENKKKMLSIQNRLINGKIILIMNKNILN